MGMTSFRYGEDVPDGWQKYAFDIDGKASSTSSTDHCILVAGAQAASVKNDGPNGVDNSFARNVMPMFTELSWSLLPDMNQAVAEGGDTMALVPLPGGGDPTAFPVAIFRANGAGVAGPTAWKVFVSDVTSVSPLAGAAFPDGTKADNVFASGLADGVVMVPLVVGGYRIELPIHAARISATFAPDGSSQGSLGGYLKTAEVSAEIKKLGGTITTALCPGSGSALEGFMAVFEQASDILADGTQSANATCNGITFGVGFTAKPGKVDGIFTPSGASDPCAQ